MARKKYDIWEVQNSVRDFMPNCNGTYVEQYGWGKNGADHSRGAHAMAFNLGSVRFYFSYKTLIGVSFPGKPLMLRENVWGPTTGKHLSAAIADSGSRTSHHYYPADEFWVIYAGRCAEYFGLKGVPDFAIECEPGSFDKTGRVVQKRKDEWKVLPSKKEAKELSIEPPPVVTREDKIRRRELDRQEEAQARWEAAQLFKKRSAAAKKAAVTRKANKEREELVAAKKALQESLMNDAANFQLSDVPEGLMI